MLSSLNPLPHLSSYRGPHKVGSTEFEIPVNEIASSSRIPDDRVTTIKFRLFYPTPASSKSKKSIPWLPEPQKPWNQAYARFMGISENRAELISKLPSLLNYVTIPAVQDAPLLDKSDQSSYPVVIFSHGLGGNYNTYSSLVGSLASCGAICAVPEHRDGSAPISFIKSSSGEIESTIPYQNVSHSPTVEVLNSRNKMLRVRLWELELLYTAITQINNGKSFTNFSDTIPRVNSQISFTEAMDLSPSRVTWSGHSFGAATVVQFVKSVYHRQHAPQVRSENLGSDGWDWTPIYTPAENTDLAKQITPDSPVALLDLWTMPLRGEPTRWLWERPLPCYHRKSSSTIPNTIAIMSAEFHKWTEALNRTRALLSENALKSLERIKSSESQKITPLSGSRDQSKTTADTPSSLSTSPEAESSSAEAQLDEPGAPTPVLTSEMTEFFQSEDQSGNLHSTESPAISTSASSRGPSASASQTSLDSTPPEIASTKPPPNASNTNEPHLYLVPNSAHLSQSDFGPLFPNLNRYLLKVGNPDKTMELNIRAVLAMMRGCGLPVGDLEVTGLKKSKKPQAKEKPWVDRILEEGGLKGEKGGDRWERLPLVP